MTNSVYYFSPDSSACEQCQAMAGIYVDESPSPPHENCDCNVIEYTIGEGEENCAILYRDTTVNEGYGSHSVDIAFNCDESRARVYSVETSSPRYDIDAGLQQAAEAAGWRPELAITQLDFEVPADSQGTIHCTSETYDAIVYAEKYVVCTIGGAVYEKHIDSVEGEFYCVYDYAYTVDSTRCSE